MISFMLSENKEANAETDASLKDECVVGACAIDD